MRCSSFPYRSTGHWPSPFLGWVELYIEFTASDLASRLVDVLKAPPSLSPSSPSYSLMPPCPMLITTKSTEGDLAHHSSTVMCVLVVFAGIYSLSFMDEGCPRLTPISPVLFLFGAGTFARLAYRRWSEESSTGDTRIHTPHPPVLPRRKVSYPASGINRVHANTSQGPSPPHVSLPSKGEQGR